MTMLGTKIGQLVIKRQLGEGGMGAVYYAEHELLDTRRAIKVLLPRWTADASMVQRFVNEARAAASIRHRNIIAVHDCGQLPSGTWYIVMDYLEGQTLGRFGASSGRPVPPPLALRILAPTANGLEAAHRAGIIHRDLKPDNIFLIRHELGQNSHHPVILDFGIAKLGEREGGAMTRTGMTAGTPAYMAPEQMQNLKKVDQRSDVYALGVIAYQMITGGYLPYQTEATAEEYNSQTAAEIYHRLMSRPPIDPRERCADVPERWATAIRAALDVDPARRPQSARAFALMLAEGTAGDAFTAGGTDIVRTYANELLEIGNLLETVRAPKPATGLPDGARSRYQLGECLGAGGMAEVFRGTMVGAEGFARPVAVKRVLPGFSTMPQFSSMFIGEAQLAAKLLHENIVAVLDFDRDPEGRLFLVMEYVEGRDLATVAATGRLPLSVTNFVISEVLRGLGYAHELPTGGTVRGVVHRDVSPQNVLLSWEGAVKVSDFGIAKAREASAATASTLIKGKVHYMSPEQANGERLDGRSDLFAVGVMLWEMLTGQPLFQGTNREVIAQVLFRDIPLPRAVRANVPADLEAIAMRLLAKDPAARYANAAEAIEDLARCADAPRNGPAELARLLAERFPEAIAARSSRPELGPGTAPGAASTPDRVTVHGSGTADQPPPPSALDGAAPAAGTWQPAMTSLGNVASQAIAPPPSRARRHWLGGIVAASALLVFGVLTTTSGGKHDPSPAEPPRGEAGEVDSRAAGSSGSAAIERASILVVTEPPGAVVRVDGAVRGTSPMTIVAAPGQPLAIEIEHEGYRAATHRLAAARDGETVTIPLAALPNPPIDAAVDADATPDAGKPIRIQPPRALKEPPGHGSAKPRAGFEPDDVGGD